MKYGTAISTVPLATSQPVLDTMYGNTINASPYTSDTITLLFPYTKKPSPIAPNNPFQSSEAAVGSIPPYGSWQA